MVEQRSWSLQEMATLVTSICGHISEEVGRPGGRKPGTPGGTIKSSYGARSHLGQFQVSGVWREGEGVLLPGQLVSKLLWGCGC